MLLALDVGNTNVTVGAFEGRRLVRTWRQLSTPAGLRELKARARALNLEGVVYGSVVPPLDPMIERVFPGAVAVTPRSKLGIRLKVKRSEQVGADRILNALAAHQRSGDSAALVLDFGTATTFDCVDARGDYLGGAILLGPNLAAEALHRRTAKLPLVSMAKPRRAIGRDTVECIQAGLYFGYLGMIEKVLGLTLAEMGGRPKLYATGGLAFLFKKDLPPSMEIVPNLTLDGLRIAYGRLTNHGE